MFAPCLANSRAMALPIPLLPPVTIATLFFKSMNGSLVFAHRLPASMGSLSSEITLAVGVVIPVNAAGIGAIQNLNRSSPAEIAPRPIYEGLYPCSDS